MEKKFFAEDAVGKKCLQRRICLKKIFANNGPSLRTGQKHVELSSSCRCHHSIMELQWSIVKCLRQVSPRKYQNFLGMTLLV